MVYDPSSTPVYDLIVADIVSTLRAVEPPDYATDLASNAQGRVRLWDSNAIETNDSVLVVVVPQGEENDDSPEPLVSHVALFSIVLATKGIGNGAATALESMAKLKADVEVALTADGSERRGGVAVTTRVLASRVFDRPRAQAIIEAQVDIAVDYRTFHADPTSAF